MVEDGISPEAVSQYKEQEVGTLLLGSDAVLCPTCRASSHSPPIPPSREWTPTCSGWPPPVANEGLQSYSCAGGWNLFMNTTRDPNAAYYEFVRLLNAPEQ